jgi:hypothetical protein
MTCALQMETRLRAVATALPLRMARLASAERKRLATQLPPDSPLVTVRHALHAAIGRIGADTVKIGTYHSVAHTHDGHRA